MEGVMRLIGAHVSAAGGHHLAVERAAEMGCNCVQVFSGSPRVWARAGLDKLDAAKVTSTMKEKNVQPMVVHSLYLVNLISENPELVEKSINALAYDLEFTSKVNGPGIVVHVGSHQGRGWEETNDQTLANIQKVLDKAPNATAKFFIENSAGQNGKIGSDLAEVAWLLERLPKERMGWCMDTCHAHAAGYSFGEKVGAGGKSLYEDMEKYGLWTQLGCIHVNDSRDPFASHRDRHANLGEGSIAQEDLKFLLARPELKDVPLMLEVPGADGNGPDAENVQKLKELVGEA